MVNLYRKYKDKGFKIYSVSLDNQKARWVQAIQRDQLEWSDHVSELAQRVNGLLSGDQDVEEFTGLVARAGRIAASSDDDSPRP